MTNVYSLDGILVFGLYEGQGVISSLFCLLAAVIGTRLHAAVAIACVVMAFYVLFIK
ncbi:PREDICTED: protein kish-B [Colobus angolensis palliatus]|uniref:protein kish-B n=1 Tax=Colobus angolensis palliatus TaxID=336983 RepID=UPI0005F4581A|nr:PREDICTED: protein kish-B [Colobus angolensis palliatus]